MISRVDKVSEIEDIINYIGSNYKSTPYLYVNAIQYGLGTENVHAWIDRTNAGQIEGVYLLYYDCVHFYTNDIDNYPLERLSEFIVNTDHKVIMLQGKMGDRLEKYLSGYYSERNHVIDMDKVGNNNDTFKSTIAEKADISEIADLLMADSEYVDVYDRSILLKQMEDRYDRKFSRYFVAKIDGKIVATCSTYGEVPGFALVGGVIVHPKYRKRGLAADVENYACHTLEKEGISRVGFVNYNNTASLELHRKIGAESIASLAKFIKKSNLYSNKESKV